MKILTFLCLIMSTSLFAQGDLSPAQQQQLIQEASRVPAESSAQQMDPVEAQKMLEKIQKAKSNREEEQRFLEELDQE